MGVERNEVFIFELILDLHLKKRGKTWNNYLVRVVKDYAVDLLQ